MPSNPQTCFSSIAGQWGEIRAGYFAEHTRDSAIAKARLPVDAIVADVGCGTGFVAAGLAPHAREVYGLVSSATI